MFNELTQSPLTFQQEIVSLLKTRVDLRVYCLLETISMPV
jgi:hypothetical protein